MSLKETLMGELKTAMKEKDEIRKNTITMVRAAILQVEKDQRITLDEEGILDVIAREVKKRRDSLPDYEKSNRPDLVEQIKEEINILLKYLPTQLTEEEIREIVKAAVDEVKPQSPKDMGKLMAVIMPKVKGRADGKIVNQIVKEMIS
jgi:uncharacterized protein YqeY